jgi:tryptophan-rich sensory protein
MRQNILNLPSKKSLAYNIALFLLIQIIISFLVFGLGWDEGHNPAFVKKPYIIPSGALVGSVWIMLYLLMSYSRWYLNRFSENKLKNIKLTISILLIWCSLYPFYTFTIDSAYGGIVGNAGIFSLSSFIIFSSWEKARLISYLILPVLLWIVFATTIILSELGFF